MKFNYSSKKIGGYFLAVFVLFGVAFMSGTSAQAQYPYGRDRNDQYRRDRDRDDQYRNDRYRRDDRYGRGNSEFDVARQQGYSYGMNVGAADAQRGQSYNPQRSHYWRDGSAGYSGYGNRGQYKQVFRDAFAQGYREGFQRYGYRNGRSNNGRWGNGRIWPW